MTLQPRPLTPWGNFTGQRRLSDSPYIESVWEGTAFSSGVHLTAADGTIDLTLQTRRGVTRLLLSGPTSRVQATAFEAGDKVLAMRLRSGVHLPFAIGTELTDVSLLLDSAGTRRFWLQNMVIAFPDFDNAETFAEHLAKNGLLERDIVIENALAQKSRRLSIRTVQRHFLAATGLTMNHVLQIKRAEHARGLLNGDHTFTRVAYDAGYSNPGHMTNAFKYFFGKTPSALRALMTQSS